MSNVGTAKLATIVFLSQACLSFATAAFLALAPFIAKEMHLSHLQVGLYCTSLYGGSLLASLVGGWFVDRFQVRLSFTFGLGFVGVLICFLPYIHDFGAMMLLVMSIGIAQSVVAPAVNKGVMSVSSFIRKRATVIGLMTSAVSIGGLFSFAVLPVLGSRLGWQPAMLCAATPALVMSLVSLSLYRDPPYDSEPDRGPVRLSEVCNTLRDPSILSTGIVGLVLGGVQFCVLGFFPLFLYEQFGISPLLGASTLSIAQGAGMLARPLWGVCSDYVLGGRRKGLLVAILLLGGVCCLGFPLLTSTTPNRPLLILIGTMVGITIFGWPSIFNTILSEYAGRQRAGIVSGAGLGLVRVGILTFPPLAGFFIDKTENYKYMWLVIAMVMILAGLAAGVKLRDDLKKTPQL